MTFISETFKTKYKDEPAQILVLRNNGYCWGCLILKDGREFDIQIGEEDYYDYPDEDVFELLDEHVQRGEVDEVTTRRYGWDDSDDGTRSP